MLEQRIKPRTLLGPGPSNPHPSVLAAMSYPLIGHLDPQFIDLMVKVQEDLRYVFQTKNPLTIPVSGTGSAGMEAALCNFIDPGDRVLVGVNGYFGERICDMAGRYGAEVRRLERPWGEVFTSDEIRHALEEKPAKIVCLIHAETSTGALQPLEDLASVVHRTRRAATGRLRHLPWRSPVQGRRLGDRYRIQCHSEVPQRPAGPGTAHRGSSCHEGSQRPQDEGPQLVPGSHDGWQVLGC